MKGQVAFEYAGVILISFVGLIILFIFAHLVAEQTIYMNMTTTAVDNLTRKVDEVYYLGAGSKLYVTISLPPTVTDYILDSNRLVTTNLGTSEFSKDIVADANGILPSGGGSYRIKIEMLDPEGIVQIS